MAGGSDSQTTTQSMPAWMQPYAENYLKRASQVADLPYQQYSGQRVASFNPAQQYGMNAIANRAMSGSPIMSTASQTLQDTAGGKYLGAGNPYLQQQIDATSGDIVRNYNLAVRPQQQAREAQSGSFGNTGLQQQQNEQQRQLAQTLGNVSSGMRMQGYNTERANQMQSLGMAPQYANQDYADALQLMNVGQMAQDNTQRQIDTDYQNWQAAQNYPRQQLATMGSALGMNAGGTTTQTGGQGSQLGQGLGAGLSTFAMTGNPYLAGGAALLPFLR